MERILVGGGPIGLYAASRGSNMAVFDQKKQIGSPIQCTGLLSHQAQKLLDKKLLKEITQNTITKTEIIGPTARATITLRKNYVINNQLFEERLADNVLRQGNKIHLNKRYEGSKSGKHLFKDLKTGKKETYKTQELLGIDGPNSNVRRIHHWPAQEQYIGMQARLRVKKQENSIQFFPHIGVYAWSVPESDTVVRVGLATKGNAQRLFHDFLKRFSGKILERSGGRIPLYKPRSKTVKQLASYRVVLLGDAGGQIKNTTGGGLLPGITATNEYIQKQNTYTGLSRTLRQELYTHFLVHNLLKTATRTQWDKIILSAQKQQQLFKEINRDETRKMIKTFASNKTFLSYSLLKLITGKVKLF